MKLKAISANYTPASKLMLALGVFLISMVVFTLLNFGIAELFYGVTPAQLPLLLDDLSTSMAVEIAKVLQSVSTIGFFIVPSLLLAFLISPRARNFLRMNRGLNIYSAAFVIITAVAAIPLINYLGDLNAHLYFPRFLSGLESWVRDYEGKAEHMTAAFLKMETPGDLISNIFIIGMLPAIGEELFFRGVVQRILSDWTKNKHWAVWITAIIFSTVHLQFLGFVPRLGLGVFLGYLYIWSGSLWLPIIAHFINNAAAVVLSFCYSTDLFSFNPINIGVNDDSMVPVLTSALLVAFLVNLIYRLEKRNKWFELTVATSETEVFDYDKILLEHFDTPIAKVIAVENTVREKAKEEFVQQLKKKKEAAAELAPMEAGLANFELSDLSDEAQKEMVTRMNLSYKLGSAAYYSFLYQFGFITTGKNSDAPRPTALGLLMLGKSPQLQFPQARIKFTIHRGKEDPVIKDFEGPLVLMPGKIEEYLDVIVSSSISREQFHRVVLSEIPKKVLREVIINAIVHRDYAIEGARIMVDAFHDRVEVSSPGIPRSPMKKFYECNVPSISRNQKISYIFNQMHLVEERGLGMKELKSLKEDGNPPDFKLEGDIFITVIYRSKKPVPKTEVAGIPVSDELSQDAIKSFFMQRGKISAGDYAARFQLTSKTAQRHLGKLIEEGMIGKEGDRKGTKYFLKQQGES